MRDESLEIREKRKIVQGATRVKFLRVAPCIYEASFRPRIYLSFSRSLVSWIEFCFVHLVAFVVSKFQESSVVVT